MSVAPFHVTRIWLTSDKVCRKRDGRMQRTLLRRHQARRQLDSDRCFTKPLVEPLEERALLTATLSPITGVQLISLSPIVEFNGQGYFSGNDGTHGFELWRSDGTQ